MANFNFDTKLASPEWLTGILTDNGFLTKGKVSSIVQTVPRFASGSFISTFQSLKVTYTKESLGFKPSKILLKAINQEYLEGEKQREFKNP